MRCPPTSCRITRSRHCTPTDISPFKKGVQVHGTRSGPCRLRLRNDEQHGACGMNISARKSEKLPPPRKFLRPTLPTTVLPEMTSEFQEGARASRLHRLPRRKIMRPESLDGDSAPPDTSRGVAQTKRPFTKPYGGLLRTAFGWALHPARSEMEH